MCVLDKSFHLCQTLCDLMDCNLLGSSVHGVLQVRILEWIVMPSSVCIQLIAKAVVNLTSLFKYQDFEVSFHKKRESMATRKIKSGIRGQII